MGKTMILVIHRLAATTAFLCIVTFFFSTLCIELLGSYESVAHVKSLIVMPGLFVLIPSMAIAGGTGFKLSQGRKGRMVDQKKKRMPLIAMNGLLILLPAAIVLNLWAADGSFDSSFYTVQVVELVAGAVNGILMGFNIRDGKKLTRKR